jgi:hypothetical protein
VKTIEQLVGFVWLIMNTYTLNKQSVFMRNVPSVCACLKIPRVRSEMACGLVVLSQEYLITYKHSSNELKLPAGKYYLLATGRGLRFREFITSLTGPACQRDLSASISVSIGFTFTMQLSVKL